MSVSPHKSHLRIEGVDETNKALFKLLRGQFHEISQNALIHAIEPARMDILRFVQSRSGKHDSQRVSKKSGTWNRWRFKNKHHAGHSPGFTRHEIAKAVSTRGYGFGHYLSRRTGGIRVWLKTWAPGMLIAELGRFRDAQYTGWQQILRIMARHKYDIQVRTKEAFESEMRWRATELKLGDYAGS